MIINLSAESILKSKLLTDVCKFLAEWKNSMLAPKTLFSFKDLKENAREFSTLALIKDFSLSFRSLNKAFSVLRSSISCSFVEKNQFIIRKRIKSISFMKILSLWSSFEIELPFLWENI